MTLGTLAEESVEVQLERTAGLGLGVLACLLVTSHGTDLCPRSQCDSRSPSLGAVPSDITLSPQDCLCLWLSRPVLLPVFKKSSSLPISNAEDFTVRLWPRQLLMLPQKTEDFPRSTELRGHQGPVSCCSFSTDGCRLATGGRDRVSLRRMHLWALLPMDLQPLGGPQPLDSLAAHFLLLPLAFCFPKPPVLDLPTHPPLLLLLSLKLLT